MATNEIGEVDNSLFTILKDNASEVQIESVDRLTKSKEKTRTINLTPEHEPDDKGDIIYIINNINNKITEITNNINNINNNINKINTNVNNNITNINNDINNIVNDINTNINNNITNINNNISSNW